jgi:hypothetical protein
MSDLGLRVTFFLFLLDQLEVCLCARQLIFGLIHFARRGCALLLQALQGLEIALRRVALAAGLHQLGFEGQNFFAIPAPLHGAHFSLGCADLGQGSSRLAAGIGVVQLSQKLSLLDAIAFLDQQLFYRGADRRVSFKTL